MGFIWRTIDGDIEDLDSSEIRTRVDEVLDDIQTSWTWTDISGQSEDVLVLDALELRDAVDFADDQNYCRSDHVDHWNSARFNVDTAHDVTHYPGHLSTYLAGYDATHHPSYWNGHYPGHLNNNHGAHHPTHYPDYNGTHHPVENSARKDSYDSSVPITNVGCGCPSG